MRKWLLLITLLLVNLWLVQSAFCQDQQPLTSKPDSDEHRLAGKVIDSEGKPINDAIVVIQISEQGMESSVADTRTMPDGRFKLDYNHLVKPTTGRPNTYLWISSTAHALRCVRPAHAPKGKQAIEITMKPVRLFRVSISGAEVNTLIEPYRMSVPNGIFDSNRNSGLQIIIPDALRNNLSQKLVLLPS